MIGLSHVTAGYPGKRVLQSFSLELPDSGAVALMAPSGYGKTTLLRVLAGLIRPESGEITGLDGKKIAFLFQEDRLLPWLTAEKNVEIVSSPEKAKYWLRQMERALRKPEEGAAWSSSPKKRSGSARRLRRRITAGIRPKRF